MPYLYPTAEELEPIVEELGLEIESLERLTSYTGLMAYCDSETDKAQYLRDNLPKWADWEQETYYGQHDTPADFTKYYLENYVETDFPNWVKIDYNDTWDCNLRHDFYFDASGHVWAEVY